MKNWRFSALLEDFCWQAPLLISSGLHPLLYPPSGTSPSIKALVHITYLFSIFSVHCLKLLGIFFSRFAVLQTAATYWRKLHWTGSFRSSSKQAQSGDTTLKKEPLFSNSILHSWSVCTLNANFGKFVFMGKKTPTRVACLDISWDKTLYSPLTW